MRDARYGRLAVAALALALAAGTAACGGEEPVEEMTEEQAELDREMELALEGDTGQAELRDEAVQEPVAQRPPQTPPETRTRPPQVERRQPAVERATEPAEAEAPPADPEPRAETPAREEPRTVTVPAGSDVRVALNQTLSTEDSRVGDLFTARVLQPVTGGEGGRYVAIPQGSTVRGRVTAVQPSGGQGQQAIIQVALTEITVDDATYPFSATVVEANPETRGRSSTGEKAVKIGAGTAAGAILGRVIGGGSKGTVIGAVAGAAAGTAITLGTEDVDAVLAEGSEMVLRTDEPFAIPVSAM